MTVNTPQQAKTKRCLLYKPTSLAPSASDDGTDPSNQKTVRWTVFRESVILHYLTIHAAASENQTSPTAQAYVARTMNEGVGSKLHLRVSVNPLLYLIAL